MPLPDQYFPHGLYGPREDEVFVDCGAYDGDTLQAFLRRNQSFTAYHAYEPDPGNAARLRESVGALPAPARGRVTVREAATFDAAGEARFTQAGDGSAMSSAGEVVVRTVRLDDEAISPPPTFIKADVEGAEEATLLGGAGTIRRSQPTLAFCVYHRPTDLWELPLLCHDLCPESRLHLRMHAGDGFDIVLYAVPPARSIRAGDGQ